MHLNEFCEYDAVGLAELVRNGEVEPRELCELVLEAVDRVNPALNAVLDTYADKLDGLDASTLPSGALTGVPFFLKDIGPMEKGRPYEAGSRLLKGNIAEVDTDLFCRFRDAGLINFGRTTCPEQGYTITTESLLYGTTRNPWNLEHIAGGSSSGAAASVAAGIVPIAHANDGGGSTRIPASVNGLVGLKTSRGRIPQGPYLNDLTGLLFSDLVVSRTVRDTATVLDAVHGPGIGEAFEIRPPTSTYVEAIGRPPESLRIGFCAGTFGGSKPAAEIERAVEETARTCESLGHRVEPVGCPFDYAPFHDAFMIVWCGLLPAELDEVAAATGRPLDETTLEPMVLAAYQRGRTITAGELIGAFSRFNEVTRTMGAFFEQYDLLLTPTLATPPPRLGRHHLRRTDVTLDEWFEELFELIPYTPIANATGQPAISLPLAMSEDGLPVGMHFMSGFGGEDLLLSLAGAIEEATPWISRRPGIHVADG